MKKLLLLLVLLAASKINFAQATSNEEVGEIICQAFQTRDSNLIRSVVMSKEEIIEVLIQSEELNEKEVQKAIKTLNEEYDSLILQTYFLMFQYNLGKMDFFNESFEFKVSFEKLEHVYVEDLPLQDSTMQRMKVLIGDPPRYSIKHVTSNYGNKFYLAAPLFSLEPYEKEDSQHYEKLDKDLKED